MTEIEFFNSVSRRHVHSVQPLDKLLKWATSNKELENNTLLYKEWLKDNPDATPKQKSEKKVFYFPAVIFSGTFTGTGKAEDIDKISGLFVLDFDHINNLIDVKKQLEIDPYTFLLFTSPSGDGIKLLIKHNLIEPKDWRYLYLELETYYNNTYSLDTDKSGKDISRMCFLPYVEDLFRNDSSKVWQYSGEYEKRDDYHSKKSIAEPDDKQIQNDLYTECFYVSSYLFENKIDITNNYDDWISYGYSLCALGENGREIFHNISCISDKYDPDECDQQYNYMLEHFDEDKTNIFNYLNNAKKAIAHQSIFKKYGFMCS